MLWRSPNLQFNGYCGLLSRYVKRPGRATDHLPRSQTAELYVHSPPKLNFIFHVSQNTAGGFRKNNGFFQSRYFIFGPSLKDRSFQTQGTWYLSLLYSIQTSSGTHSASSSIGTTVFLADKTAGNWSWPLISIYYRGKEFQGSTSSPPSTIFSFFV
jgi:hypothetical protein